MLKHAHQGRKGQTVIYCETQVQTNSLRIEANGVAFQLQPGTDNVEYQGNGTWSIHHPKRINELIENQVEGGIPALRPGDWDSVVHTPPQN